MQTKEKPGLLATFFYEISIINYVLPKNFDRSKDVVCFDPQCSSFLYPFGESQNMTIYRFRKSCLYKYFAGNFARSPVNSKMKRRPTPLLKNKGFSPNCLHPEEPMSSRRNRNRGNKCSGD